MKRHFTPAAAPAPMSPEELERNTEPSLAADEAELETLFNSIDISGAVVKVHRKAPGSNVYTYVAEMPAEGFSIETVKTNYGGGSYRFTAFNAKGKRVGEPLKQEIDPRFRGTLDPQIPSMPTPQAGGNTGDMLQIVMQMGQQNTAMMMQMFQASQAQQAQTMQVLATAFGKPLPTPPPPEPMSQLLTAIAPFMSLLKDRTPSPQTDLKTQIETLRLLRDLADTGKEDSKGDDKPQWWEKVAEIAGPVLMGVMSKGMQPMPQALPAGSVTVSPSANPRRMQQAQSVQPDLQPVQEVTQAKGTPGSGSEPQSTGPVLSPEDQSVIQGLRTFIPIMANAAQKNTDVVSYHDFVESLLDEHQYARLVQILERPDWLTVLFNDDAAVLSNREWFENLRDVFLNPEAYDESAEPANPAEVAQDSAPAIPTQPAGNSQ